MWSWDSRTGVVQFSEPMYRVLQADPLQFERAALA